MNRLILDLNTMSMHMAKDIQEEVSTEPMIRPGNPGGVFQIGYNDPKNGIPIDELWNGPKDARQKLICFAEKWLLEQQDILKKKQEELSVFL